MPLAPITDVTQVQVSGALAGGENWSNVLNFRRMSAQTFDQAHAEALGAAIREEDGVDAAIRFIETRGAPVRRDQAT